MSTLAQESLRSPDVLTLTFCHLFFFNKLALQFIHLRDSILRRERQLSHFLRLVSPPGSSTETLETLLVLRHLNIQPSWTTGAETACAEHENLVQCVLLVQSEKASCLPRPLIIHGGELCYVQRRRQQC